MQLRIIPVLHLECEFSGHNFEEPKRTNIRKLLEENGYTLVRNIQLDDWFLNSELLAERGGLLAAGRIPRSN